VTGIFVEKGKVCLLNPKEVVEATYQRHLEVAVKRDLLDLKGNDEVNGGSGVVARRLAD